MTLQNVVECTMFADVFLLILVSAMDYAMVSYALWLLIILPLWLGGVAVGRRICDQEVTSSIPGCSAARCNSGQVVHTHVPLFTKQYKLVPASAGE